jgi:hypothetical protein
MAGPLPDDPQALQCIADAALGDLYPVVLRQILAPQGGGPYRGAGPEHPRISLNHLIKQGINDALRSGRPPTTRGIRQPLGQLQLSA